MLLGRLTAARTLTEPEEGYGHDQPPAVAQEVTGAAWFLAPIEAREIAVYAVENGRSTRYAQKVLRRGRPERICAGKGGERFYRTAWTCTVPEADPAKTYVVRMWDRWGERVGSRSSPGQRGHAIVCQAAGEGWQCGPAWER